MLPLPFAVAGTVSAPATTSDGCYGLGALYYQPQQLVRGVSMDMDMPSPSARRDHWFGPIISYMYVQTATTAKQRTLKTKKHFRITFYVSHTYLNI